MPRNDIARSKSFRRSVGSLHWLPWEAAPEGYRCWTLVVPDQRRQARLLSLIDGSRRERRGIRQRDGSTLENVHTVDCIGQHQMGRPRTLA